MLIHRLLIDSHVFRLDPDENVTALKAAILRAARRRAAFVVFTPVGSGPVSVLVTPHTPVRFEVEDPANIIPIEWDEVAAVSDVEDCFEY